jgi:hypothetical protein
VTFEAASLSLALDLASRIKEGADLPTQVEAIDSFDWRTPTVGRWRAWSVEVVLAPMRLGTIALQMVERRMLSLEYRSPGSRFLGFTTDAIPGIAARSSLSPDEARQHS